MSYHEESMIVEDKPIDDAFLRKISPILVLLVSSLLLYPFGFIDSWQAAFLLLCVLVCPIVRLGEHQSLRELGIKFHGLKEDIMCNWYLIIIPVVAISPMTMVVAWLYPPFSEHIISRVPIDFNEDPLVLFMQVVIIGPLVEEILFRGLLQRYTSLFAPKKAAILYASVIFALFHYASGDLLAMTLDLLFLFIRGCIYGLIYSRSQNALVSCIAHSLVNLPFW